MKFTLFSFVTLAVFSEFSEAKTCLEYPESRCTNNGLVLIDNPGDFDCGINCNLKKCCDGLKTCGSFKESRCTDNGLVLIDNPGEFDCGDNCNRKKCCDAPDVPKTCDLFDESRCTDNGLVLIDNPGDFECGNNCSIKKCCVTVTTVCFPDGSQTELNDCCDGDCEIGDGGCNIDTDCSGELICGPPGDCFWTNGHPHAIETYGNYVHTLKCCEDPVNKCFNGDANCCTGECLEGEGDCDDDSDCAGDLACGVDNCGYGPSQHDCCYVLS